jgi:hypothetical protein
LFVSVAMKLTLIGLLYALSAGLVVSPVAMPQPQRVVTKRPPEIAAAAVCPEEAAPAPQPARDEVAIRGSDPKPVSPPPDRPVLLTAPPRPWVFSDKTWRAINDSWVNIDMGFDREDRYVGVRIIVPFGS